jgi:pteridine reductase
VQGKSVLITGGAKRVGAAICRRLHIAGANLMLHYRASAGEARLLQAELNHIRQNSVALIQADLLDLAKLRRSSSRRCIPWPPRCAGQQRIVVFPDARRRNHTQQLGRSHRHQPSAPLFLAQAAASALKKSQGVIVNITDIHAERPLKNFVVYSVAKAGLVGLTRSLARELAPEVRVNAVAPGPILWPDDESFDELSRQRIISHTPLRREGTPEDIARAVHYLIVDASYVTGEMINVDGGRHVVI